MIFFSSLGKILNYANNKKKIPILIGILFLLSINGLSYNKKHFDNNSHSIQKNEAYTTLTDSTIYYDFGVAYYYAGLAPKEREAINKLIKNKNYFMSGQK